MQRANHLEMSNFDPNRSRPTAGWYRLYSAALLERDRNKALPQIEQAQRAIHYRQRELDNVSPVNPREAQELSKASTYLGILLRNVGTESEQLLWD